MTKGLVKTFPHKFHKNEVLECGMKETSWIQDPLDACIIYQQKKKKKKKNNCSS